jgi:hypothetical protein
MEDLIAEEPHPALNNGETLHTPRLRNTEARSPRWDWGQHRSEMPRFRTEILGYLPGELWRDQTDQFIEADCRHLPDEDFSEPALRKVTDEVRYQNFLMDFC